MSRTYPTGTERDHPAPRSGGRSPRGTHRGRIHAAVSVLAGAVVTAVVAAQAVADRPAAPAAPPPPAAEPAVPPATRFYSDPHNPAARWAREHPRDPRAAAIRKHIAARPQAVWLADPDPNAVRQQVHGVVHAAETRRTTPVLVAYAIPRRDCGGKSTGGTGDLAAYRNWIHHFAQGIGSSAAMVVLEPDALAHTGCLDRRQRADRFTALSDAGRILERRAPRARVYYDAGNSGWHSAATTAERLRRTGVERYGDGIALNVSNFNTTEDEARYGLSVLAELGSSRLGVVIDTSRNGAGPTRDRRFCDPPRRALGPAPTTRTGVPGIDAYLWVKHPGQADGCIARAGAFVPEYAYRLTR